jgi:hypothetical protein
MYISFVDGKSVSDDFCVAWMSVFASMMGYSSVTATGTSIRREGIARLEERFTNRVGECAAYERLTRRGCSAIPPAEHDTAKKLEQVQRDRWVQEEEESRETYNAKAKQEIAYRSPQPHPAGLNSFYDRFIVMLRRILIFGKMS